MKKLLPKTVGEIENGGVYAQKVRCGKSSCHCANGDLHHGYYYFIQRVNGRQSKTYVRKEYVERLTSLISIARMQKKQKLAAEEEVRKLLVDFRGRLREYQSLILAAFEDGKT